MFRTSFEITENLLCKTSKIFLNFFSSRHNFFKFSKKNSEFLFFLSNPKQRYTSKTTKVCTNISTKMPKTRNISPNKFSITLLFVLISQRSKFSRNSGKVPEDPRRNLEIQKFHDFFAKFY